MTYPLSVAENNSFVINQNIEGIHNDNIGNIKYQWYTYPTSATSAVSAIDGAIAQNLYLAEGINQPMSYYCTVSGVHNNITSLNVVVTPVSIKQKPVAILFNMDGNNSYPHF